MTPQERLKIWRQEQQKGQTAEDRRRIWAQEQQPAPAPQPQKSAYERVKEGLSLGLDYAGQKVSDVLASGGEMVGSALHEGDFSPLREAGERALRGAAPYVAALGSPTPGSTFVARSAEQAPQIADVKARQTARREKAGDVYFRGSAIESAELDERAAQDPSLLGKAARFVPQTLPYVAAGVLSGGSAPALAATGAVMSLDEPETLPLNVALSALPVPSARAFKNALAPILKRIRARGVPAAAAEVPTPTGPILRTGAVAEEASIRGGGGVAALEAPPPGRARLGGDEGPPLLEVAEESPFEVSLGKERARTPGKVGPRYDEAVELEIRKQLDNPALAKAAERSPWQDTTLAYFRANLLTNPGGRATDLGSTLINQFADAAARPVAAAVDVVVSKLTGVRGITGPSLRGTGRALGSIRQGLKDAKEVLKTGKQAIDSGADDAVYSSEIRSGLGKGVDLPINGVFRVLGALDAPFRRYGFARNLFDRAKVAALNEARRGKIPRSEVTARLRQLLDDEGIIRAAVRDGEASVLSQPNMISSGVAKLTANRPNARLAFGLVQPFLRIPLNAVHKAADFSGIGGVKALFKVARGLGRKYKGKSFFKDIEDQRVFSQNVAAGSFGPAAFILGMELEDQGKMEGYYHTGGKDYPNGKVPTSINIGGQNYDINRLGGFIAAPLFIGATYNRLRKQGTGKADALLRSFSGLVQTAPALGYYGVPAKVGRIFTSEEPTGELAKEAGGIAAGFIPASGALGAAAKAVDPEQKREAEGLLGPIMNRVPGLRQQLPVKKNKKNAARR